VISFVPSRINADCFMHCRNPATIQADFDEAGFDRYFRLQMFRDEDLRNDRSLNLSD
jgi:aspartyl-tRNA synthetase